MNQIKVSPVVAELCNHFKISHSFDYTGDGKRCWSVHLPSYKANICYQWNSEHQSMTWTMWLYWRKRTIDRYKSVSNGCYWEKRSTRDTGEAISILKTFIETET